MNPKPTPKMAVQDLELSNIVERLQSKEKFAKTRAEAAVVMYRQFLQMAQDNPQQIMVPNEDVDAAWHHHILDTQKYARDCKGLFGLFLHHDPEASKMDAFFEACEQTQSVYNKTFGDGVFLSNEGSLNPAICGGMLKDEVEMELKPAICGGMLKDEIEVKLKPAICGGMLKDENELGLKPAICGGMLKDDSVTDLPLAASDGEFIRTLKPAICGGMLKDDTSLVH